MADMRNAESAILMGQARHKRWLQHFMEQWTQPAQDQAIVSVWINMPEEVKDQLRQRMPDQVAEIDDKIAQLMDV